MKIENITTEKQTSKGNGVSWHEELESKEKIKFMKMQGCYCCKKGKKEREKRGFHGRVKRLGRLAVERLMNSKQIFQGGLVTAPFKSKGKGLLVSWDSYRSRERERGGGAFFWTESNSSVSAASSLLVSFLSSLMLSGHSCRDWVSIIIWDQMILIEKHHYSTSSSKSLHPHVRILKNSDFRIDSIFKLLLFMYHTQVAFTGGQPLIGQVAHHSPSDTTFCS